MAALWFASVGDVCALLVDATAGGDPFISSILRTGPARGGLEIPVLVPGIDAALGGGSSTSSMLLTGERGVNGEEARPGAELAEPLCREAGVPSNKAKTSLRSSSSMDSNDMWCDIIAIVVSLRHLGEFLGRCLIEGLYADGVGNGSDEAGAGEALSRVPVID
jgi:hypothetical protein